MEKYTVLILNRDYTPHDIWDWKHAMTKYLCTKSVEPVYDEHGMVQYNRVIRDGSGNEYVQPAVLVLTYYVNAHTGMAPYTKLNIYARDMGTCQYCGEPVSQGHWTVDHVIPRAHWNPRRFHFRLNSFENVVTACGPCNKRKRNRTPQQAGMDLIQKPKRISRAEAFRRKRLLLGKIPDQWKAYLKVMNVAKT